jgi:hypothetical protein
MNLLVENKIIGITSSIVPWRIFSPYLYFNVNHLSSMLDVCEFIELSIHMEEQSISNARYWFSICFADDVYVRWATRRNTFAISQDAETGVANLHSAFEVLID